MIPRALKVSWIAMLATSCAASAQNPARTQRPRLSARLLKDTTSLCDLSSRHWPSGTIAYREGASITLTGCGQFDAEQVAVLLLTIRPAQPSADSFSVVVPAPQDVTVSSRTGSQRALAAFHFWGSSPGFATEATGRIELRVPPGTAVELAYLVPKRPGLARVTVAGIGSSRIAPRGP
jgi:hypothetical protein